MKKPIGKLLTTLSAALFLLSVPALATDDVAIDKTNFPDSNFRSYVSDNFDTDGNGSLSAEEIAAAQTIEIVRPVDDLTGIEYLTELKKLNTGIMSPLEKLDVSKNTKLEVLYCAAYDLTELDVSKNVNLKELECSMGKLTKLDVSKNAKLEVLYCFQNQLTELDVSNNPELRQLDCAGNQLTTLNVGGNLKLEGLYCAHNQLKELNVSKNTALQQLKCGNNQLTKLDVSNNLALLDLECEYNQLTELDVSGNTALVQLDCRGNQLQELAVTNHPNLCILYCGKNQLASLDVSNTNVETFGASDNQRAIEMSADKTFDLTTLPGFDVTKASNWDGGTVNGTVLTLNADTVTYDYDCGRDETATFALKVTKDHTALAKVDAKAATCAENGNSEYWHCSGCGKNFLDEAGTKEAAQESIVIPALRHKFTNYVYNNDAKVGIDGTETAHCDRDGCDATDTRTAAGTAQKPEFVDVQSGAYYADAVDWAAATGVTTGVDNTHFEPDEGCTRAQMVTFLWRTAGKPEPKNTESPFTDVQNPNEYYYKAVLWAAENRITAGVGNNQFAPNQACTRAQAVLFIYRAAGDTETYTENPFKDVSSKEYYYKAVLWGAANGVVAGTSNTTFSPDQTCTRAQGVSFLHRVYGD